jgi:hypothetical protein
VLFCNCCQKSLSEKSFYESNKTKCKKCIKAYQRRRRNSIESRERILAYDNERSKTQERKQYALGVQRKRRAKYPEKAKARNAVSNALRDGRILRQPCEVCGAKAQAHHDDYSKPLEVRWLCFQHHRERAHKQTVGSAPIQPFLIP